MSYVAGEFENGMLRAGQKHKNCFGCHLLLKLNYFERDVHAANGLDSYCRDCRKKIREIEKIKQAEKLAEEKRLRAKFKRCQ